MNPYAPLEPHSRSGGEFEVPKTWPSVEELANEYYRDLDPVVVKKLLRKVNDGLPYDTASQLSIESPSYEQSWKSL